LIFIDRFDNLHHLLTFKSVNAMRNVSFPYFLSIIAHIGFVFTLLTVTSCELIGLDEEEPTETITPKPAQLYVLNLSAEGFTETINDVPYVYPRANIYLYKYGWNTSSLLAEIGNFTKSPYRINFDLTINMDSTTKSVARRYGPQFPFKNIALHHYTAGGHVTAGHIVLYKTDGVLGNYFDPNYYDGRLKVDTFSFVPGPATSFISDAYYSKKPINTYYRYASLAPDDIVSSTTFSYVWVLEHIAFWMKNSQTSSCNAITTYGTIIQIPKDFNMSQMIDQLNQQPIAAFHLFGSTSLNIYSFSGSVFPADLPESLGTKPDYPLTLTIPRPE
jgi:hypothetical protein